MPARGGGGAQQHGSSSTAMLVRSDQDSGMALIKSKDGRTKWLTVSTDPSSTPSSTTWDERVRSWASMLGVCAAPPSTSPGSEQRTPLPTPPPSTWDGQEGEEEDQPQHQQQQQQQQQQPWPSDSTADSASSAAPAAAAVAATAAAAAPGVRDTPVNPSEVRSATTAETKSNSSPAATAKVVAAAGSTARRKPVGTGKRVGSFARGFLLGLGGGGGSGGTGSSSSKRMKSPTAAVAVTNTAVETTKVAAAADTAAAVAPASGPDDGASAREAVAVARSGAAVAAADGSGDQDDALDVLPMLSPAAAEAPATETGSADDKFVGRDQWVKGARRSSSNSSSSSNSGSDSENHVDRYPAGSGTKICVPEGSKEGGSHGGGGSGATTPCSTAAAAASTSTAASTGAAVAGGDSATGAVTTVTTSANDGGMDWLETGPGGSSSSGSNTGKSSSGVKAAGGGSSSSSSSSSSKKKKKSKTKGKGGGGGKSTKSTKKLSSCSSSSEQALSTPVAYEEVAAGSKASEGASGKAKRAKKQEPQQLKKEVTFGRVNLLEFTRDVGGCGVPSDGTWGLSLGLPFRETEVDVDGYEASKDEILEERMSELSRKQRHLCTGETRQFDYRPVGVKNPLFARLGEKERSKKLLEYACFHKSDLAEADKDKDRAAGISNSSSSSSSEESNRNSNGNNNRHDGSTSEFDAFSHKVSHAEFVDKSQAASIELTALRDSRRTSQGCSCSCVRADKLNLTKLRGQLGKRGLKASGSKKELVKMLQEAMRREEEENGGKAVKACRGEDCQCVRDGVECHADLCNCCKGPSIGEKGAHHGGNCGNPEGVYAYHSSVVRAHRGAYVSSKDVPGRETGSGRSDSICSDHH
ncbi:unnamed protein product [Pylaiella littoralis]